MKVLVIGQTGQMAQALRRVALAPGETLVCVGRPDADLSDAPSLASAFAQHVPDIVINAAAYTSVDKAESEPDLSANLNAEGPARLAKLCHRSGIPLIHLSTDCAFDGTLNRAYFPEDPVHPIGVYGRTKVDGERAVRAILPEHLIIRVSWIFSHLANNFVTTMLSLAKKREEISVVEDQFGCPTHAPALAQALLSVARQTVDQRFDAYGTYHLAGSGETDRASLAEAIFARSAARGGPRADVRRVPTSAYPTPARRPLNARLNSDKMAMNFGVTLPEWESGLENTLDLLIGPTKPR